MAVSRLEVEVQRKAVIEEALLWRGTPYHHGAHVRGAGVSCSWFLAECFNKAVGPYFNVVEHNDQWYLSDKNIADKNELYLSELKKQGFVETDERLPGNIILSRTNNTLYCHGGIVVDWPSVIHCVDGRGVHVVKSAYASWFFGKNTCKIIFLTYKEWA